ncbi:MAG: tetratricopeptide repeat protein [Ekhidna sp.]
MIRLVTLSFLLLALNGYGQSNADSLKLFLEKAESYAAGPPDSLINYSRSALKVALETNADQEGGTAAWLLGIGKRMLNELDSSEYYFEKALTLTNDPELTGNVKMGVGGIKYATLELDGALSYFLEAAVIFEKLELESRQAAAYTNIGMVLNTSDSDEKALTYFKKSLEISKRLSLTNTLLPTLVNISILFEKNDQYDYL